MHHIRLAVIGVGSLQYGPPIVASLATHFGERPVEVRFWDPDRERLHLLDMYARTMFGLKQNKSQVGSTADLHEALRGASGVIIAVTDRCASKFLECDPTEEAVLETIAQVAVLIPEGSEVINLTPHPIETRSHVVEISNWPPNPSEYQRFGIPFDLLRVVHGEDYPYDAMEDAKTSPLKDWLSELIAHQPNVA